MHLDLFYTIEGKNGRRWNGAGVCVSESLSVVGVKRLRLEVAAHLAEIRRKVLTAKNVSDQTSLDFLMANDNVGRKICPVADFISLNSRRSDFFIATCLVLFKVAYHMSILSFKP